MRVGEGTHNCLVLGDLEVLIPLFCVQEGALEVLLSVCKGTEVLVLTLIQFIRL